MMRTMGPGEARSIHNQCSCPSHRHIYGHPAISMHARILSHIYCQYCITLTWFVFSNGLSQMVWTSQYLSCGLALAAIISGRFRHNLSVLPHDCLSVYRDFSIYLNTFLKGIQPITRLSRQDSQRCGSSSFLESAFTTMERHSSYTDIPLLPAKTTISISLRPCFL